MSAKDILQNIFSVKNEYGEHNCHKVINILGIKVKLKRGKNQIPANLKKHPLILLRQYIMLHQCLKHTV